MGMSVLIIKPFTITSAPAPNITVRLPNTAVKWKIGTDQNITWNYTGNISKVKIEFSSDGHNTYEPIINSTDASALSYTWHIPNAFINYPSAFYTIKISDANNPKVYDEVMFSLLFLTHFKIRLTLFLLTEVKTGKPEPSSQSNGLIAGFQVLMLISLLMEERYGIIYHHICRELTGIICGLFPILPQQIV